MLIEDSEFIDGSMNGEKVLCGKFAGSLRKKLMLEHLGLEDEDLVQDCIGDTFYKDLWISTAAKNTKLFEETFFCVPTNEVKTLEENRAYLQRGTLADSDKYFALKKMKNVKGYLVMLPLSYLENTSLLPPLTSKEGLAPTELWT